MVEKAQTINKRLSDKQVEDIDAMQALCNSYEKKAKLELTAGHSEAAKEWYEKALAILMQINEKTPGDDNIQKEIDNLKRSCFLAAHFTVFKWALRLLIIIVILALFLIKW